MRSGKSGTRPWSCASGSSSSKEIGRYALDLEVEATDGVVSLRGKLPDRLRKRLALDTAKETQGVKTVIDLLDVR